MYIHVWNEKMIHNGTEFRFCKCKNWLPVLCMGFKDTIVCGMKCREYLCPDCVKKTPENELTGRPIYTVDEYLAIRNEIAAQSNITIKYRSENNDR